MTIQLDAETQQQLETVAATYSVPVVDVIKLGIRTFEEQQQRFSPAIQLAISEGIASGDPEEFDPEAFEKQMLESTGNAQL